MTSTSSSAAGLAKAATAMVVLGARQESFSIVIAKNAITTECVAIAPRIERGLEFGFSTLVAFVLAPTHRLYKQFCEIPESGCRSFDRRILNHCDPEIWKCLRGELTLSAANELFDVVTAAIASQLPKVRRRDPRIDRLFELLGAEPAWPMAKLCAAIGISYDRVSHLFADEVGLPLKSYRLWAKARAASRQFNSGKSLTEIAHASGFTDSAHLSRTFKTFFDVLPSNLVDSGYVRVFSDTR